MSTISVITPPSEPDVVQLYAVGLDVSAAYVAGPLRIRPPPRACGHIYRGVPRQGHLTKRASVILD
jgi:hypothetical protein